MNRWVYISKAKKHAHLPLGKNRWIYWGISQIRFLDLNCKLSLQSSYFVIRLIHITRFFYEFRYTFRCKERLGYKCKFIDTLVALKFRTNLFQNIPLVHATYARGNVHKTLRQHSIVRLVTQQQRVCLWETWNPGMWHCLQ